jgi:hypothetical protein
MAREAKEELDITVAPADLRLVHTLHDLDADDGVGRLQLFFRPNAYTGAVTNVEPDKCHELRWWPLDGLPEPLVRYTRRALTAIAAGEALSVCGFPS